MNGVNNNNHPKWDWTLRYIGIPASALAVLTIAAMSLKTVSAYTLRQAQLDNAIRLTELHTQQLSCHDSALRELRLELRAQRPVWQAVAAKLEIRLLLDSVK